MGEEISSDFYHLEFRVSTPLIHLSKLRNILQ